MTFKKARSTALAVIAGAAVLASSLVAVTAAPTPAQAWSTTDFKAGSIIDDALFYDGTAMTASQIQTFLNSRAKCIIGTSGYEAGTKRNGNTIAEKCLRSYKAKTTSKAANSNCKAYSGKSSETAAQIIAKVGKACGISPKVLLVTLQKEQSLVTDTWPYEIQYDRAMGYACPDSGPGGSANCDKNFYGFFNQVYSAAWQFKNYKSYPMSGIKQGTTSTIKYHPSNSCGTSKVKIANYATAALYTYTPYRPNTAALNAGFGSANNSCSSYGNRNFFNFWNSWFGSVRANLQITGAIKKVYDAAETAGASYGAAVSPRKKITANGGGYQMVFENGIITTSTKLGKTYGIQDSSAYASDTWATAYLAKGGASGSWGFIAGETQQPGYRTLAFQNGTAIANSSTINGVRYLPSRIYAAWVAPGAKSSQIASGPYGWPTADAYIPASTAASQHFEKGTLMAAGSKSTLVDATDLKQWNALGGYSAIGFFTGNTATFDGKRYRTTQKGTAYFADEQTQVFLPNGALRTAYIAAKGPKGTWGWPAAAPGNITGGARMKFSNGYSVHRTAKAKTYFMAGKTYNDWVKRGGVKSVLGYPTANTKVLADGSFQRYAKYAIFYGPKKTIQLKRETIVNDYLAAGGPATAWGWPTAKKTISGGKRMTLSNGYVLYEKSRNRTVFVSKESYQDWSKRGGTKASIGYPSASTKTVSDGSYQQYSKHYVYFGPTKKIAFKKGAVTKAYMAAGGPKNSGWGWPVAKQQTAANGTITVAFSGGTLKITKSGAVSFKKTPSTSVADPQGPGSEEAPQEDASKDEGSDSSAE
ncbi:LGFP repeat-containing protein [Leucobacter soli]|nr:hypothetical protein [Leucobacter soli]